MSKLVFLGTGCANNLEGQMTSLCFVVGRQALLIDCGDGMGTMRQLVRANVPLSSFAYAVTIGRKKIVFSAATPTAKNAGIAAAKAGAKQLILTHLRPSSIIGDGSELVKEAKKYFSGPVQLAEDLMEIAI